MSDDCKIVRKIKHKKTHICHLCNVNSLVAATMTAAPPLSLNARQTSAGGGSSSFKVCVIGHYGVGKSSLLQRFRYGIFEENMQATIGVDFLSKTLFYFDDEGNNQMMRLQIWDTAGGERFRSLVPSYARSANVFLVVYDVCVRDTFHAIHHWVDMIHTEHNEGHVVLILVGNKCASAKVQREVSYADGKQLADHLRMDAFIETDAKYDIRVTDTFELVRELILKSISTIAAKRHQASTRELIDITAASCEQEKQQAAASCC
jgi:Ras-related protein Rab-6A